MDTFGPVDFHVILLLYRDCPLSEVTLHCHGPVETTEFVLYREVKCTVSIIRRSRGSTVCTVKQEYNTHYSGC